LYLKYLTCGFCYYCFNAVPVIVYLLFFINATQFLM
jgi:hypothetical protein